MADSSRVFVRNIPLHLKEEDFKKHFSQFAPITDVKFIPRRRIGYIGYKSPDEAAKAVKYFNKSFIRMSKINVELAKPMDQLRPHPKSLRNDADNVNVTEQDGALQETQTEQKKDDPKLNEFLKVMAPSSKSKTWANEDELRGADAVPLLEAHDDEIASDRGGDEYQVLSKKRKRSLEDSEAIQESRKTVRTSPVRATNSAQKHENESASKAPSSVQGEINDTAETAAVPTTVSDADWLRSRTSRLLGLENDDNDKDDDHEDDQIESKGRSRRSMSNSSDEGSTKEDAAALRPKSATSTSDAASQTEEQQPVEQLTENSVSRQNPEQPSEKSPGKTNLVQPMRDHSDTGRLFVRNLSYETTEKELNDHFSGHGEIAEVHISRDTKSGSSKGFGYVQYSSPDEAVEAMAALDGKPFQGRLLHILPAAAKKENGLDEFAISKLPLKKQREIKRRAEASTATFKWNSLYMNPDAVLSSVSNRLGVSKSDVLDPTSTDAAVRQAHAETNVIQETKTYFASQGVNLDAFMGKGFHDKAILVKNFSYGTTPEEIKKSFEVYGTVVRLLMPPSATIAIVEMEQATQAKSAFGSLAYRKFKDSVLFLEKAPKEIFDDKVVDNRSVDQQEEESKLSTSELLQQPDSSETVVTSTLFVRNLNFDTTSQELMGLFKSLTGFLSATVKTKSDPKKPGQVLSMGFGFAEFRSKQDARSALAAMNGYRLAGHDLIIKESHKALDAAEERRREDAAKKLAGRRTKIVIKNLPFEATKKDVRALFGPYGQLRSVRVPKKFDHSSRGFAFADFITTREAESAMKALSGVHLLGRRLNLDFAAEDTIDPEEEIEKMAKKVGKQADRVAIQKLTSGGRKRFSVHQGDDAEIEQFQ